MFKTSGHSMRILPQIFMELSAWRIFSSLQNGKIISYQHSPGPMNVKLMNTKCHNGKDYFWYSSQAKCRADLTIDNMNIQKFKPLKTCQQGRHFSICNSGTGIQNKFEEQSSGVKLTGKQQEHVEEILQHLQEIQIINANNIECGKITELVVFLLETKMQPNGIKNLFEQEPKVLNVSVSSCRESVQSLIDLGFTVNQLAAVIMELPEILTGNSRKVCLALDTLRSIGFRDGEVHRMVLINPELLYCPTSKVHKQYKGLLKLFPKAGLATMLIGTPSLLTEPMSDILQKFEYVKNIMGVEEFYMVRTNFLQHNMTHIYARHQFLERAGLYSKPDQRGRTKTINPTLKNIMDTDDRYFALKIAGLSKAEYVAFENICDIELTYGKGAESIDHDDFSEDEDTDNYDDESDDDNEEFEERNT